MRISSTSGTPSGETSGASTRASSRSALGFHHALGGNHRGAMLLLRDGIEKTVRFVPVCLGIDTARLVRESQACLDAIAALEPEQIGNFNPEMIPLIYRAGSESAPFARITVPEHTRETGDAGAGRSAMDRG